MKKIITVLICIGILPCTCVSAQTQISELSAKQSGSSIEISGNISDMTVPVISYCILKPGVTEADKNDITDTAALIGQSESVDENGAFSFEVSIGPRAETGDYTVIINTLKGGAEGKTVFRYISDTDRSALLDVFNSRSTERIYSAMTDSGNKEIIESFGIDLKSYESMADERKRNICALIASDFAERGGYTIDSFGTAFNIIAAYTDIMAAPNAQVFEKLRLYSGIFGITTDDMYEDSIIADSFKNAPVSGGISGVIAAFNSGKAVSAVNNTISYMDIYDVILKYNDIFNIDLRSYSSLSASSQTAVCKAMIGKYSDPESVKRKFENAVSNAGTSNSHTSSGGGGGGGGGGSITSNAGSYSSGSTTAAAGGLLPGTGGTPPDDTVRNTNAPTEIFSDIDNVPWAYEAITVLAERGILSGTDAGTFEPDRNITRAEFTKMIAAAFGLETANGDCSYSDVSESDWYYEFIAAATTAGIVNGMSDGSFGADNNITREDIAVIAYRAASKSGRVFGNTEAVSFSDSDMISDYAAEAVSALSADGVIDGTGDNSFEPKSFATRAQAAKIVYMLLD